MKRVLWSIVGVALFVLVIPSISNANQIIFTHTGSGAGSIDGANFSTTDFTITATGDTSSRDSVPTIYWIDHLTASIDITGVGIFDFTTGTRTFVNNSIEAVGFSRAGETGADLFDGPQNALFATWDMLSSIGPIAGSAGLLQWSFSDVNTTGGVLLFDSQSAISATFQAQVDPVPEPATMLLLGTGLVGVAGAARRRKKNQV